MTNESPHIIIESGIDIGKTFVIPDIGARIGRAPENDIQLNDPALSRFQSRLFFRDGALWVADLGSTNETLVNDNTIQEVLLRSGDVITIGESNIRVIRSRFLMNEPEPVVEPTATDVVYSAPGAIPVDLGLAQEQEEKPRRHIPGFWWIISTAAVVLALALILPTILSNLSSKNQIEEVKTVAPKKLFVSYERVKADSSNIFRYQFNLDGNKIKVTADNLIGNKHVEEEGELTDGVIDNLRRYILSTDYFGLDEEYESTSKDRRDLDDITISIGNRAHRVKVKDHRIPPALRPILDRLDTLASDNLPLAALRKSTEELKSEALIEYANAEKLYEDRKQLARNLWDSVKKYERMEQLLKTVDPRPDYYNQALDTLDAANQELDKRISDLNVGIQADLAQRLWSSAAEKLRLIRESVPDPADDRYINAQQRLIDVELKMQR